MMAVYLLSVWLHTLAAVTWLGGMIFLVLVLVPVTRQAAYRQIAGPLFHVTGVRFRWVGWICLGLLVLTGSINLAYRGVAWSSLVSASFWQGSFGHILGEKLLLVAVILVTSAYHDFVVGPRATLAWRAGDRPEEAQRLRRQAGWLGRINLVLALAVVALAVMLVRGGPW